MSVEFRLVSERPRIALSIAGAGEVVIFLHGVGTTRSSWDAQLAFFRHAHFAAAWDARGCGDSDDYAGDLDFSRDFVADLAAVEMEGRRTGSPETNGSRTPKELRRAAGSPL